MLTIQRNENQIRPFLAHIESTQDAAQQLFDICHATGIEMKFEDLKAVYSGTPIDKKLVEFYAASNPTILPEKIFDFVRPHANHQTIIGHAKLLRQKGKQHEAGMFDGLAPIDYLQLKNGKVVKDEAKIDETLSRLPFAITLTTERQLEAFEETKQLAETINAFCDKWNFQADNIKFLRLTKNLEVPNSPFRYTIDNKAVYMA